MTISIVLAEIAGGRRPADDGLLGNCRLEWGRGEAYGEEAILASFRAAPLAVGDDVIAVRQSAAWIGEDAALVADLYGGRIGRLWRVGVGAAPPCEPAVSVAIDTDLRQQRGGVSFRAADHPELNGNATEAVLAAATALLAPDGGGVLHRSRAFVLRAFSGPTGTVALFALYRLGGGDVRTAGFVRAVAMIAADGAIRSVVDQQSRSEWTPRL